MVDWDSLIPTVVALTDYADTTSGTNDIYTACIMNSTTSGSFNMDVEAGLDPTFVPTIYDVIDDFTILDESATTLDIRIAKTIGVELEQATDISTALTTYYPPVTGHTNIEVEHSVPITLVEFEDDIDIDFKIYIGSLPEDNDIDVDITLSNDRRFTFPASMFCTVSGLHQIETDIETASGKIAKFDTDIFSTAMVVSDIEADMFCTVSGIKHISTELETAKGYNKFFSSDIFSTAMTNSGIGCDVRTWSLFFGSFFLDVEDFTTASAVAWIDIIDYMWPIDTTNCYFEVDGIPVAVTFSGITNGQRMFYDPLNDFDADDVLTYTVHAQNTQGDIREQSYYLLYGYDIDFNEVVDWGASSQVDIVAKAINEAFCPQGSSDAFYFVTRDLHRLDLQSTIKPVSAVDLGSTIRTQSTAFYYGKTYTVTVSGVRDFAGNELNPFDYTFTIREE